jgi:chemotaxis protein MotB
MRTVSMVWLSALLASGCVSKGSYELLEVKLDATRAAMSARSAQSVEEARALEERVEELQAEIARRQVQLDELVARAADTDVRMQALQQELAAALAELEALRAEQVPPVAEEGDEGEPVPTPRLAEALGALDAQQARAASAARMQQAVAEAFDELVQAGKVSLREEPGRGVVVVVVPKGQLFQEGWTTLSPRGEVLAADIASALKQLPGREVRVEGHTDTRPKHSAEFASNWERGFAPALTLVRVLTSEEVPVALSVASVGGERPLVEGTDEVAHATNNRLELVVAASPDDLPAFEPTPEEPPEPSEASESTDAPQPVEA